MDFFLFQYLRQFFSRQIVLLYFAVVIGTDTTYRHDFADFRLNLEIGEGIVI